MQWVSAISTQVSLEAAVQDVVTATTSQLSAPPDLALVFISSAFASEFSRLLPLLEQHLEVPALIGCSGGGIIGTTATGAAEEVEDRPALSLCLAHLPGVQVQTFHLTEMDLPDLDSPPDAWVEEIGVSPATQPQFILLAEPFSSSINDLLQGMDFAYPQAVKVGGLAGASSLQRHGGLFCDRQFHNDGVVGVALSGNVVVEAIVAQGCRPIGEPYRVAAADRNILLELEDLEANPGKAESALVSLKTLMGQLSEQDRKLAQHSLFIGVAQDGFKRHLSHGDFLIRNLLGVDPRTGALAVGDRIRPGQRIQFHLRDADASAEDLTQLLQRYQRQGAATVTPAGALMFACLGRGEGLYRERNFDSHLFQNNLGPVPISGFFCNGEIGPIGETTFLHGYTSVFGICRQPTAEEIAAQSQAPENPDKPETV
jgi:small ligand-binding sensory domain FIST